ncbi:hypothetical protein LCGC14_1455420, partial [marine sediment metagenome]
MSVEIRATPTRVAVGVEASPAANTAREQIAASQVFDWLLKGYIFSGGSVLMDASDIATVTTQADTTPTIVLQSPAGTEIVVVPLRVRCSLTDDGGGLSQLNLVYTISTQQSATKLAFTGGTELKIQNSYTANPAVTSRCTLEYTVTSAALTATDSIVIAQGEAADAALTTGFMHLSDVFDY